MITDKILIIIAVCFLVLLFTHYLAVKIGFTMGTQTNPDVLMSTPKKTKADPYIEKPDEFDEEMLDFE